MKKVIVAAAGLMLVGTMATSAMAEFKFSGDARTRFYYQSDYDYDPATDDVEFGNSTASDSDTRFNSRVRFKIEADTKGGAYAKTRIVVGNGTFGEGEKGDVTTDYAYIGVPFGPITIEGGRMPRDITPFLFFDGRAEGIQAKYRNNNTGLVVFYDTVDEDITNTDDDDLNRYGALLNQGFDGWNLTVGGFYQDDARYSSNDPNYTDGFAGTVKVDGTLANIALTAEIAYQDKDLNGNSDDGYGGYIQGVMPVGPVSLLGMIGTTQDGFEMDAADFGPFVMLNDYSQISTGFNFAEYGDSVFAALAPTYKASEKLTLGAQVSMADVDADTGYDDFTAWEIGATASYAVVDGAKLNGIIAYMDTDDMTDDNPVGFGLSLEISF